MQHMEPLVALNIEDFLKTPRAEVLGLLNFQTCPIAHCLRDGAGWPIPRKAEDEQAIILGWLLDMVRLHGQDWNTEAKKVIEGARHARAKAWAFFEEQAGRKPMHVALQSSGGWTAEWSGPYMASTCTPEEMAVFQYPPTPKIKADPIPDGSRPEETA